MDRLQRNSIEKKNLMGLGYTNGLALGQELKKFREFKRMFKKMEEF